MYLVKLGKWECLVFDRAGVPDINSLVKKVYWGFEWQNGKHEAILNIDLRQGRNQGERLGGAEAPPLAKSKFKKMIKYRIVWCFCVLVIWICVIWSIYGLKIDYDTEKLQKVAFGVIFRRHQDYVTEIRH